jgi:hypothetical protein
MGNLKTSDGFSDEEWGDPDAGATTTFPTNTNSSTTNTLPQTPDAGSTADTGATEEPDMGMDTGEPDMGEPDMRPEPGTIVEFRIAEGTGTGSWNTQEDPVVVYVGQILRLINEDSRDHQLHAGDGAAVDHGNLMVPGQSQDLEVTQPMAPMALGDSPQLYDHNDGRSAAFWLESRE